ncbi:MAG: hypothetical protein WC603_04015 [Candidatus Paceibacterota bacterium]|jgi:hypothetical protein
MRTNDKKYEYGLKEFFNTPFLYFTDFLTLAHNSRKKSLKTFIIQTVNIVLMLYVIFRIIPFLSNFISSFSYKIEVYSLGNFFLMIIIVFSLSVLSEKVKLSNLFKCDFYVSILLSIFLICGIIGFNYYDKIKKPN